MGSIEAVEFERAKVKAEFEALSQEIKIAKEKFEDAQKLCVDGVQSNSSCKKRRASCARRRTSCWTWKLGWSLQVCLFSSGAC